jgi:hypothetical protein
LLHDATKYALDPRNPRGKASIPDNIKFLAKRRYAYEIFLIYQLKIRYDISEADLSLFQPDYQYLIGKDKIDHGIVWRENIDKLYVLHQRIMASGATSKNVFEEEWKQVQPKQYNVSYGKTFSGRRIADPVPEVEPDQSEPPASNTSSPKKVTIVRKNI